MCHATSWVSHMPMHTRIADSIYYRVLQTGLCVRGDRCPYAHNVFEYWLHPTRCGLAARVQHLFPWKSPVGILISMNAALLAPAACASFCAVHHAAETVSVFLAAGLCIRRPRKSVQRRTCKIVEYSIHEV